MWLAFGPSTYMFTRKSLPLASNWFFGFGASWICVDWLRLAMWMVYMSNLAYTHIYYIHTWQYWWSCDSAAKYVCKLPPKRILNFRWCSYSYTTARVIRSMCVFKGSFLCFFFDEIWFCTLSIAHKTSWLCGRAVNFNQIDRVWWWSVSDAEDTRIDWKTNHGDCAMMQHTIFDVAWIYPWKI